VLEVLVGAELEVSDRPEVREALLRDRGRTIDPRSVDQQVDLALGSEHTGNRLADGVAVEDVGGDVGDTVAAAMARHLLEVRPRVARRHHAVELPVQLSRILIRVRRALGPDEFRAAAREVRIGPFEGLRRVRVDVRRRDQVQPRVEVLGQRLRHLGRDPTRPAHGDHDRRGVDPRRRFLRELPGVFVEEDRLSRVAVVDDQREEVLRLRFALGLRHSHR